MLWFGGIAGARRSTLCLALRLHGIDSHIKKNTRSFGAISVGRACGSTEINSTTGCQMRRFHRIADQLAGLSASMAVWKIAIGLREHTVCERSINVRRARCADDLVFFDWDRCRVDVGQTPRLTARSGNPPEP